MNENIERTLIAMALLITVAETISEDESVDTVDIGFYGISALQSSDVDLAQEFLNDTNFEELYDKDFEESIATEIQQETVDIFGEKTTVEKILDNITDGCFGALADMKREAEELEERLELSSSIDADFSQHEEPKMMKEEDEKLKKALDCSLQNLTMQEEDLANQTAIELNVDDSPDVSADIEQENEKLYEAEEDNEQNLLSLEDYKGYQEFAELNVDDSYQKDVDIVVFDNKDANINDESLKVFTNIEQGNENGYEAEENNEQNLLSLEDYEGYQKFAKFNVDDSYPKDIDIVVFDNKDADINNESLDVSTNIEQGNESGDKAMENNEQNLLSLEDYKEYQVFAEFNVNDFQQENVDDVASDNEGSDNENIDSIR